jgi:hypothetical protein
MSAATLGEYSAPQWLLRGVNTLRFQIASHSSTAISAFRPTPAVPGPCGSSPGDPAVPQELAGAPGPRWTRPSGHMLGLGGRVLYWAACTRSSSSTTFSSHRRLLLISAHPQKNVSLRRSCGACLRRPCGAGARPLKYPEVPRARLRRAPPDPAVPCPLPPLWRCEVHKSEKKEVHGQPAVEARARTRNGQGARKRRGTARFSF